MKTQIGIELKDGTSYGATSIHASRNVEGKATITFICSAFPTTVLADDIKEIKVQQADWCPYCQ